MKGSVARECPVCKLIWRTNANTLVCPLCGTALRKPVERKSHPTATPIDKAKCASCAYRFGTNGSKRVEGCQYILIEMHRRPCPPGENCTAYVYAEEPYHEYDEMFGGYQ